MRLFRLIPSVLRTMRNISYINQEVAQQLDTFLMEEGGFKIDQLMELAGISCAQAIYKSYNDGDMRQILVVCGPGNNGGDGLVAARHLKSFGFDPVVLYPSLTKSVSKNDLYKRLVIQLQQFHIPLLDELPGNQFTYFQNYRLIVDAIFGFGFKGVPKEPFANIIDLIRLSKVPVFSIDVPSGWPVDGTPDVATHLQPDGLISLSVPKLCSTHFKGRLHWLGGRFVSDTVKEIFDLEIPEYIGCDQCVLIE